jgi:2-keto-4-pentenoate hydratase/2-oxohepta-3-ene-1,7-dioic acid hydratase in catechol pathway
MPGTVITGSDSEIPWPAFSEQIDYEVELAVIIGKSAKCVPPSEAFNYVAGYSIANDISDEIDTVQNLDLELSVNGRVRQKANTSQMIFTVADIVSFLSYLMTLEPGDVIATGTPEGVAMATGEFLQPGDKIECTIENLGTLTNTLADRPVQFYKPLS